MARVRQVSITVELLQEIFTTGWRPHPGMECLEGLPPTAEFVFAYPSGEGVVHLVFSDPSFDDVSHPAMLAGKYLVPEQTVTFRINYDLTPEQLARIVAELMEADAPAKYRGRSDD